MAAECILAIDQGTSSTKALVVDAGGAIVAQASAPLAQQYPRPGWVEQEPRAILASVSAAANAALERAGDPPLVAVAISNQRETVTAWERQDGRPLGPAIGWQCQRSAALCQSLRAQGLAPLVRQRSGLGLDPMFSGGKLRWLLDQIPRGAQRASDGALCLGTVDSWLLWHLTGGAVHACDLTNASRTQLLNLRALAWDDELLALFGVPRAALPETRASGERYGLTVARGRLPAGVPIAALVGDSHAALYGHGRVVPGVVKATYGTGSSLMAPLATLPAAGQALSATVAWARQEPGGSRAVTYALEGNIYATGAAVRWLGELLGLDDPGPAIEALAKQVSDAGGAYLVPAFTGLGAPHWDASARGLVTGLTLGTGRAQLARAALEAIAYQVRDVFEAMAAAAQAPLALLLADGGGSANDLLMGLQADILGRPVARSASPELSALGAAYLAGLTVGLWPDEAAVQALAPPHQQFDPCLAEERREAGYAGWRAAVRRATVAAAP